MISLQWSHNGHDGVSNHHPHRCLLNRLFRRRSNKTSKLRVTGLCAGNSPVTDEFPAQMASDAENVSIWWRHHVSCPSEHSSMWQQGDRLHLNLACDWLVLSACSLTTDRKYLTLVSPSNPNYTLSVSDNPDRPRRLLCRYSLVVVVLRKTTRIKDSTRQTRGSSRLSARLVNSVTLSTQSGCQRAWPSVGSA